MHDNAAAWTVGQCSEKGYLGFQGKEINAESWESQDARFNVKSRCGGSRGGWGLVDPKLMEAIESLNL